jgi:serine/threonine protein kinase
MTDRVGQQLGNYRLLRLLGRGGFADVYLGQDVRRQMLVAVKVFKEPPTFNNNS